MTSIKDKYTVKSIDTYLCKEWLLYKHYAHRIPNIVYSFGLFEQELLVGVCTFGMPPNNNLNNIIDGYDCIELNRLIINDSLTENSLSFFVSKCLNMLPKPKVVVSYADAGRNHHGYIYQATNWIYTGLGLGDIEFVKNGKHHHRKTIFNLYGTGSIENAKKHGYEVVEVEPKHRYIYLLGNKKQKADMLKKLPFKKEPYPKGDNKRYNANYKPTVQLELI